MARRTIQKSSSPLPDPVTATGLAPEKFTGKIDHFHEQGIPGIKHFWGRLYEEFLPALDGDKGRKMFVEMAWNEPAVAAFLYAIKMLTRQVEWTVDPASPDAQDVERAEFINSCMHDLDKPWTAFIADTLTSLIFGWSLCEQVFKIRRGRHGKVPSAADDGLVGWARLAPRAQETIYRWILSPNGDVLGVVQNAPPTWQFVEIPIEKLLHFKTDEWHSSPEGVSILRGCYLPYCFKKGVQAIEAIAIEREGAGLPVARMPAERMRMAGEPGVQGAQAKAEKDALSRLVRDIKTDQQQGIVFPIDYDHAGNELYKLELLSAGGGRAVNTNEAIMRYRQEIATSVLADFLLLGQDKVGSFALSSSKTQLFSLSCNAVMDGICGVLNRKAIPLLFEANGWEGPYPEIGHGDLETPDLQILGAYLTSLAGVGIDLTDETTVRYLRRAAHLPTDIEG